MSLLQKLLIPSKLWAAAWVMEIALIIAIGVEYFLGIHTLPYVLTVFYYLLLDYVWTSIRREWLKN
ncbi:MAG TPA: hypothetical protein VG839_06935 [Asticcacaulis sp.]|nr:hypothetical protein [Asticcacaulis sp.]